MAKIKTLWMLSREYEGIAGAGGVKDVCRSLSETLAQKGLSVTTFIPMYGFISPKKLGFQRIPFTLSVSMDYAHEERREPASFWAKEINGVKVVLVDSPRFTEKLGIYTYTADDAAVAPDKIKGEGHFDYFAMNMLHQKAVLAYSAYTNERPECIHCHDGHTAITPALMRELEGYRHYFKDTSSVVTMHNAGIGYHQDCQDLPFVKAITGLPWTVINDSILNGSFDPFLAAAHYACLNTVSENYARELQETELDALTGWLGHRLREMGIVLHGITNGIDPRAYDPRAPEKLGIPKAFDPLKGDLDGKRDAKRILCDIINSKSIKDLEFVGELNYSLDTPLLTSIGRLTEQKGIDTLSDALSYLFSHDENFQCVILGSGQSHIEQHLKDLSEHPSSKGRFCVIFGYNERLANIIFAAGDFFVIPSLYEPCGITDFIAQLMGNIPVVRATGGLVKVKDGFNGYSYREQNPSELAKTIIRALEDYSNRPEFLQKMRENGVKNILQDYTWEKVAERYIELYEMAKGLLP